MINRLGTMYIYKNKNRECSNGGISSRFDEVEVWEIPYGPMQIPKNISDNAVCIKTHVNQNLAHLHAIPITAIRDGHHTMFGGSFVYTSNNVVPHAGKPIHLHDRIE